MRGKLLIVDDEEKIRKVLRLSFNALGYQVVEAADGEEAESVAFFEKPDLIILDVMMPKKSGFEVCRDLKWSPHFHQAPVILLTAKDRQADIYWGYDCGADAYVTKPYDPRRLEALVEDLLREVTEGWRRVAWTGLPSREVALSEVEARRQAGGAPVVLELRWPEAETEVFRQKFGSARLREVTYHVAWAMAKAVAESFPAAILGQDAEDNFVVVLGREEEEEVLRGLLPIAAQVITPCYSEAERIAGLVVFKHPQTGHAETVRLLHLSAKRVEQGR